METPKEHITTRLSSGTYVARLGLTKVSSTESHQRAASNLVEKRFGPGFVPVRSARLETALRKANVQEWEFQVWLIEKV